MQKSKIIIIILIILIIVVSVGGTALYLTTDMLKSNDVLFQKYIAQETKNIAYVFDTSKEKQEFDLLRKSNYSETTNSKLTYLEKENDEEEVYDIEEKGLNKSEENALYKNITAKYGDNVITSIDILKQNNTLGFRLANLVQQFVSIENATLSYFASDAGLDGSRLSETLKSVDISGILDFSDEEIDTLTKTYVQIIFSDLDKSHYSSKNNSMITLANKESVTTNAYTLTINKNELDNIYKKVLNQAINDQILLGKLEQIDSKIQEAGIVEKEGESIKEIYQKTIQSNINSTEYQGQDNRKIELTVYEKKGKTVRLAVKTEEIEYILDTDNTNGINFTLKTKKIENQEEKSTIFELGRADNGQERNRNFSFTDDTQSLNINLKTSQTDEKINKESTYSYKSNDFSKIELDSKKEINLSTNEAIPVNFNDKNNILLNNYEGDRVWSILESLKDRAITSLEKTQSKINTKLLNNIILMIDNNEQKLEQQEKNNIELQKEKFNNKFILYEGENMEPEYVQKLLKTAGANMSDYQVLTGSQIRIFIKEGQKNEEKASQIEAAIEEGKNNTYNIKINYNQDGYVDTIDISVYQKK